MLICGQEVNLTPEQYAAVMARRIDESLIESRRKSRELRESGLNRCQNRDTNQFGKWQGRKHPVIVKPIIPEQPSAWTEAAGLVLRPTDPLKRARAA